MMANSVFGVLLSGLLAEALVKRTPSHLDAVFFCNSGTEAMEGALKFARAHPDRVRALVMLDSGLRSKATVGADLNPFYDALRAATPEEYRVIVEDFAMTRLFDPVDDQVIARQIAIQMAQVPAHVFLSMAKTVTAFDSADTARACTVPSLIIQSCQPFVDPAALATLSSNWHDGRVVGAGHFIQLLAPDQVIPMVRRFLELTT